MTLRKIKLERFTAFEKLDLALSPGINVFVGANATGKTHLMKVAYAGCDITKTKLDFAEKLIRVFLPSGRALGRLVKRQKTSSRCVIEVFRDRVKLRASQSMNTGRWLRLISSTWLIGPGLKRYRACSAGHAAARAARFLILAGGHR